MYTETKIYTNTLAFDEGRLVIQFPIPEDSHQKVNTKKEQGCFYFLPFLLDKHVPMKKTDFANTFCLLNLT